jgi:tetratricopeptide (TPR) repeat protein
MMSTTFNDRAIDAANFVAAITDQYLYACRLLLLGETDEYEQFCRDLVARPGQPADDYGATVLARVCAVGASSAVAPERLVNWATIGVNRGTNAARLHVLGLAYYRAGRYQRAIETLQQSNADRGWNSHAKSQNWLVLAMARFRSGESDEAQHCLETARSLMAQARPKNTAEPRSLDSPDWIEINVLLREAEALLRAH